ncbi:YceI family protein [Nucisporomicrobium flavum]|uniref:YceI family protein n=1 Tax=Nucisporomicrobium flavum TaxID=2785915 RepID=UPI0018F366D9|nr:YceI family protein [Nucisporomicrobium flavum]
MTGRPTRQWNGLTIPEPGVYVLDDAHKRIGFHAQHMMVSLIRGEFTQATATIVVHEDPLQTSLTATIQAASIDTSNAERDTHLRSADFLDVAAYPVLEFRSTGLKWLGGDDAIFLWAQLRNNPLSRRRAPGPATPAPVARPPGRFVLAGDLTVRDVTRQVDLDVDFGGAGRDPYGRDIFGFTAHAEIDRESYGLLWNVALETGGVLVGKKVRIEIAGEAIRQA